VTPLLPKSLPSLIHQPQLLLSLSKDEFCILGLLLSLMIRIDVHEDIVSNRDDGI